MFEGFLDKPGRKLSLWAIFLFPLSILVSICIFLLSIPLDQSSISSDPDIFMGIAMVISGILIVASLIASVVLGIKAILKGDRLFLIVPAIVIVVVFFFVAYVLIMGSGVASSF